MGGGVIMANCSRFSGRAYSCPHRLDDAETGVYNSVEDATIRVTFA
jgi:hypothetical protein